MERSLEDVERSSEMVAGVESERVEEGRRKQWSAGKGEMKEYGGAGGECRRENGGG